MASNGTSKGPSITGVAIPTIRHSPRNATRIQSSSSSSSDAINVFVESTTTAIQSGVIPSIANDVADANASDDDHDDDNEGIFDAEAGPPEWQNAAPNFVLQKMKALKEQHKGANKKEFYKYISIPKSLVSIPKALSIH